MIHIPAPMLASAGRAPFTDSAWIWELKFDGYRCMARIEAGQIQLSTKSGANCSRWYPEVTEALSAVPGGPHIVDGEVCVLDDLGRADFNAMHERSSHRRWYAGCARVTYCVFDLLYENGQSVMQLPLVERKLRLQRLLAAAPRALFVGDLPARAELFSQLVEPLCIEGVVAKRKASVYAPDSRSPDWVKLKRKNWQEGRRWRR